MEVWILESGYFVRRKPSEDLQTAWRVEQPYHIYKSKERAEQAAEQLNRTAIWRKYRVSRYVRVEG